MRAGRILRWSIITCGAVFCLAGFWALNAFRLNINASDSMPDHAYVMWAWPKLIWRGAVIAADPPEAYAGRFEGLYFTKRVEGLPGDRIFHVGNAVCIEARCFPLAIRDGEVFDAPLPEGLIPPGSYAAFGTSDDSLDSRYATVGLFARDRIRAVGFGTDLIPEWKELKAWLDARGY